MISTSIYAHVRQIKSPKWTVKEITIICVWRTEEFNSYQYW
jgi:hypothetical protein